MLCPARGATGGRIGHGDGEVITSVGGWLTNYALQDGGGSTCTTGTIVKSVGYDAEFANGIGDGNITSKSDIGAYSYGQRGAGPHAVSSINTGTDCTLSSCKVDGVSNPNFFYDADGNRACMTTKANCNNQAQAARTYSYTSFDIRPRAAQAAR